MKERILFSIFFLTIHVISGMQKIKIQQEPHHHHHKPEVIIIEMPVAQPAVESPHTQEVNYGRKKVLALIGLATAIVGGSTAVIVFLTK
jgi:hypothetical protein